MTSGQHHVVLLLFFFFKLANLQFAARSRAQSYLIIKIVNLINNNAPAAP